MIRTCDESRTNLAKAHSTRVSIDKSTVHRVVDCMQSYRDRGAPLLELSSYSFSKYMNFVADVDLAMSPLHKPRRKFEKVRRYRQTKPGSDKTNAHHCTSIPHTHGQTNLLFLCSGEYLARLHSGAPSLALWTDESSAFAVLVGATEVMVAVPAIVCANRRDCGLVGGCGRFA